MARVRTLGVADIFILIVSTVGAVVQLVLITIHFGVAPICVRVYGVPSCELGLLAYATVFSAPLIRWPLIHHLLFWSGVGLGLGLSGYLSVMHFDGQLTCPTLGAIPLCALSLIAFVTMMLAKLITWRTTPR